jgi:hypothetical protein
MKYLSVLVLTAEDGGFNWLPIVLGVVGAMVAVVGLFKGWQFLRDKIGQGFDYLAMKTKLGFLANLDEVLVGFAMDLYHSEIKLLKEQGKWTSDTGALMLQKLKEKAKQHFGMNALAAIAGSGSTDDVDSFLASRGEAAVVEAKARGKASKGKPVDPSKA